MGVVCQRLQFRPDLNIRVPECEILVPTHLIKHFIRNREFFKIISVMETGADHGMWTLPRYRSWPERRTNWHTPRAATRFMKMSPARRRRQIVRKLPLLPIHFRPARERT